MLRIYRSGRDWGRLSREEEPLHVCFRAACPAGEGVEKLWLKGEGGAGLLLGTLLPEQGGRGLVKRISKRILESNGLLGESWGEVIGEAEQQRPVSEDEVVRETVAGWHQVSWRQRAGGWEAELPWRVGEPFPAEGLFCFARWERAGLCFRFDERGFPMGWNKEEEFGAD